MKKLIACIALTFSIQSAYAMNALAEKQKQVAHDMRVKWVERIFLNVNVGLSTDPWHEAYKLVVNTIAVQYSAKLTQPNADKADIKATFDMAKNLALKYATKDSPAAEVQALKALDLEKPETIQQAKKESRSSKPAQAETPFQAKKIGSVTIIGDDIQGLEYDEFYQAAWMQGKRPTMEDAHHIEITGDYAFFGLYDGHGGAEVAKYAAQNLHYLCKLDLPCDNNFPESQKNALIEGFDNINKLIANQYPDGGGSTAVVAIVKCGYLFIAHVGDSRAVWAKNDGSLIGRTLDHNPMQKPDENTSNTEYERVIKHNSKSNSGGTIQMNRLVPKGENVQSASLAVSRALGDEPYKSCGLIATPDIVTYKLTDQDKYLILACDGVWDVFTNQDAINAIKGKVITDSAATLRTQAFNKGSTDNISAIVVDLEKMFKKYPAPKAAKK